MRIELPGPSGEILRIQSLLDALDRGLATGDVPARKYPQRRQLAVADLGRAKVAAVLEAGEKVEAEHHWCHGHFKIPASPLAETAMPAVSLYATDRRLFRWRFQDLPVPDARVEPGEEDAETLECIPYRALVSVRRRAAVRWSEAGAGTLIFAAAFLARGHLAITGFALMAVGAAGVLHALLMPTRWVDLVPGDPAEAPWPVYVARKKSARRLLALVRGRVAP